MPCATGGDYAAPDAHCSDDALLGGRVRLLQPARGYRVAIDAVLLASAVPLKKGQRVLDVGCGVGASVLCLLARARVAGLDDVRATGFELQRHLAALARRNVERNGLAQWVDIVTGDVAAPPVGLGVYDHVLSNPPYLPAAEADPSPDRSKALATVESSADLATWLAFCLRSVGAAGCLTLVHRADREVEIAALLRPHVHEMTILPLAPRDGALPRRLIVRAHLGTGGRLHRLPPLVLHRSDGAYTDEVDAVLRAARALDRLQSAGAHPT
jgi:tRNA1(Val) A37 N6-methylase TrmN6